MHIIVIPRFHRCNIRADLGRGVVLVFLDRYAVGQSLHRHGLGRTVIDERTVIVPLHTETRDGCFVSVDGDVDRTLFVILRRCECGRQRGRPFSDPPQFACGRIDRYELRTGFHGIGHRRILIQTGHTDGHVLPIEEIVDVRMSILVSDPYGESA